MKITHIEFENYRAFYGKHHINISGKNLLVYGENGSGKSSLYKAFVHFFEASKTPKKIEKNIFIQATDKVEVYFEFDNGILYQYTNGILPADKNDIFKDVHNYNPFLTYQRILRVYIAEKTEKSPDLFALLIETVLQNTYDSELFTTFGKYLEDIEKGLESRKNTIIFKEVIDKKIPIFDEAFNTLLTTIENTANRMLNEYFKQNITFKFGFESLWQKGEFVKEIKLSINYHHEKITQSYFDFLNEARLSALAICMYLASLKETPTPTIKILFLDDIFIGLDTSNRLPLLDILKNEFSDYQIFMTTYDRTWFELAKQWFENKDKKNWKFFEMYVDDFTNNFDVPLILETKTHIQKAEYYLAKHDYPACGSYLRKTCEDILEKILTPYYYKVEVKTKEEGYATEKKRLNALITNLKEFCDGEGLDYADFENLGIYKDAVLNPLSHNDIKNPIFKQELIDVMKVLKKLENITLKPIPNTIGKTALFQFDTNNGAEILIKENITLLVANETEKLLNRCKIQLKNIRKNGVDDISKNKEFESLQEMYKFLCDEFSFEFNLNDLPQKFYVREKNLQQLINEIKP